MVVEQLAQDYADQPVVFIEYPVDDNTFYSRQNLWWAAYEGSSVTLPMTMVDSGNEISNGYIDFSTVYANMIDTSLAREPQAEISANGSRVGDTLHFDVQVTNLLGNSLGYSNSGTVWAIVYEEFDSSGSGRLTNRFVREIASTAISPDLANNATGSYSLDTSTLSGVNWSNLRAVVLVDYQSSNFSTYDMLQAVLVSSFPQE